MSLLTDIVCTTANLVQSVVKMEAHAILLKIDEQVKAVECRFKRMYLWCGILAIAMFVMLAGISLIIAGLCVVLASAVGTGFAAMIVGVIVSLLAAVLMITIKSALR